MGWWTTCVVALALASASAGCGGGGGDGDGLTCGGAVCAAGAICCDHCNGLCVPELSGAQCPDDIDPGRTCDGVDGGGDDIDGGDETSRCPDEPPAPGATGCPSPDLACTYQRCALDGVVTASCEGTDWNVVTTACESFACGSETCAAGQICVQRQSGNVSFACEDNPCAGTALECDCAGSLCGDGFLCSTGGLEVICRFDCDPPNCPA